MKIVCASSLTGGAAAFSSVGDVMTFPEREITRAAVKDADALITRSRVRVDRALLEGSRVRFVGTATAGTDHLDTAWLDANGIRWCAAPGCNANSVAEYVAAALLTLSVRHDWTLDGKTLAVIGAGHVGRLTAKMAEVLGMRVLRNDPPLSEATRDPALRPLSEILPEADFVTLHVPLHDDAPHATCGLVNTGFFAQVKRGAVFLNASRGEVVNEDALRVARREGRISRLVLDVFDREPTVAADLLESADLVSPHIAGYSHQGKLNGTAMVYGELCRFFGLKAAWSAPQAQGLPMIQVRPGGRRDEDVLLDIVRHAYDIEVDDRSLRPAAKLADSERGRQFEKLRQNYRVRHEFNQYIVKLAEEFDALRAKVTGLGFQLT